MTTHAASLSVLLTQAVESDGAALQAWIMQALNKKRDGDGESLSVAARARGADSPPGQWLYRALCGRIWAFISVLPCCGRDVASSCPTIVHATDGASREVLTMWDGLSVLCVCMQVLCSSS